MYAKTLVPGPLPTPTLTATTSVDALFGQLLDSGWAHYGSPLVETASTRLLITHASLQLVVDGEVILDDRDSGSPQGWWAAVDAIGGKCVVVVLRTDDVDLNDPLAGARMRELMEEPGSGVWAIVPIHHPSRPL